MSQKTSLTKERVTVMANRKVSEPKQTTDRSIWIYGNPDKSELGFPMPGDLTQYIRSDIFVNEKGRYRYTQGKNADVIVLSRDGLAYGHFDVEDKVSPNASDRRAYPRVKFVYLIRKSTLYKSPVPLAGIGITKLRFGRKMTEAEFQDLQKLAGGTREYLSPSLLPEVIVDEPPYIPMSEDRREIAMQEVRQRQGQPAFRQKLIERYGPVCMISGCTVMDVIDAAHIQPYKGEEDNHSQKGLLLRSDLHTLFDAGLLAIEPKTLTVHVAASLVATEYATFKGLKLRCDKHRPSEKALRIRWQEFKAREWPGEVSEKELVLQLGVEGGGADIYRTPLAAGGWKFHVEGSTMFLDDNDDEDWRSWIGKPVEAIEQALQSVAKDGSWACFYPIKVHPEYRTTVWELVLRAAASLPEGLSRGWEHSRYRWQELCLQKS
jgi:hypothetical protein